MAEASTLHIELYNQNVGKDDIKISVLKKYKVPGIMIFTDELHESDATQLKNTIDLANGTHYLYINFRGQIGCIGKMHKTITNYCSIQNAIKDCRIYEVNEDHVQTPLTLDDMVCTMTLGDEYVKYNPELFKDVILANPEQYHEVIKNNPSLFKDDSENG